MVNTNYYIENKWANPHMRSVGTSNMWHQSQKPRRNTNNRSQTEFVQRHIKRDSESSLGNQIKQISKECKDMLRKKLEEIHVHNNRLSQRKATLERHKNYVCFKCRLRGHIAKNCPKEESHTETASPGIITHTPKIQIAYLETIHLSTDFMVEGTDEQGWNQIWYVSNRINRHVSSNMSLFSKLKEKFSIEKIEEQRKLIFVHGIGEVQIKIGSEILIIPGVHYTPEVSLNILSATQMEAQGPELTFKGNMCKPIPMFKSPADCFFDENKMNRRQNEYMEGYFRMLDESSQHREENKEEHKEETVVTLSHKCNICEEDGHIDYMCPLNSTTAEDNDYVIVKGVNLPIPITSFKDCISFLDLIKNDTLISQEWNGFRNNFIKAYTWFYSVYLKRNLPGPLLPKINGIEIHLMDLHKLVETLGGYLTVDFSNRFPYIAETFGLEKKYGQNLQDCYNQYLNVFNCFYKTARVSHYEAEGHASKGKGICQEGRDDQVTNAPAMDIQKHKKVEHFGVKLEDPTDFCQEHQFSTHFNEGTTSKDNKGNQDNNDCKDDFTVIV
ncbi:cytochrome P450, ARID DNA-binding domain, Zinc finger, CCHC-type [Artemisia annua]|uniref:Cytochrome P450, ARID DNA-binding domain, Zinc finger, CCHC-type n=1 Tax=Artemisia annua TaxID=35608 RepID=A0A2U1M3H0_ARTAN|nr:cytochrome P450, ARID DNA-binding domain, Zinc finger, CCHC-type [Artemisia annua]